MYTIAVELHGLTQLRRLQPELIDDVRRQCIAAVEIQGGTFVAGQNGLQLFRFQKARPEDHDGIVECLEQLIGILRAREAELAGWNVYADYIQARDDELAEIVRDRMALVHIDNCAWIGADAESLIGHYLQLEPVPFGSRLLHRVLRSERGPSAGGTAEQLAVSPDSVDRVLEALNPNELSSGAVLVYSEDIVSARANSLTALATLAGESRSVGWLELEPRDDASGFGPLISGLTELHIHETRFWLSAAEQSAWDERVPTLHYLMHPLRNLCLPDRLGTDLISAFELYVAAYVRRAEKALAPPVLFCHAVDRWPATAADALAGILARFDVSAGSRPPLVLATASALSIPAALVPLVRHRVRLPRMTNAVVRDAAATVGVRDSHAVNWERLSRLTGNRSDSVLHYLTHHRHWDALPQPEIEDVTAPRLAWRVIAELDRDVQEALLAISYAGDLLRTDDLLEMLTVLGIDRVRVTSIVSRLRSLALIHYDGRVTLVHPELGRQLEMELGETGRTVYRHVAAACLRLLQDGRLVISEELVRALSRHDGGRYVPELHHMLVSRTLDERDLGRAHRLLYDSVPTGGFSPETRTCMQAALYADRLRLALLQGNLHEAERIRNAAQRIEGDEACDFVNADLALARARLTAMSDPGRETLAVIKRAIMMYQNRNDQVGLARANLDFGLMLLAQENDLQAREYFQLASKMAAASGDLFEQVRADFLQMVSTFIHGNFSRVLIQAASLAERTGKAGMREMQLFAGFASARALFELGRYEDAATSFDLGRTRARFYGWKLAGDLLRRWLARALVHDNRARRGIEMLGDEAECRETCLFLGEAWLRLGDHGQALAALDRAAELPAEPRCSLEAISWGSGFAAFEDRAIGVFDGERVIDHLIQALRGFVLAESGRMEEGVEELHRLTRETRLSEIDPYNRLYYYLYSVILPESGEPSMEDRGTVLGRAVRYIQQQTSRLDEYAHKTDFLRRNYWNSRLMSHAQSSNLV